MSYSIGHTPIFEKELKRLAKKYPSLKSEIFSLATSLQDNPIQGWKFLKIVSKLDSPLKVREKERVEEAD